MNCENYFPSLVFCNKCKYRKSNNYDDVFWEDICKMFPKYKYDAVDCHVEYENCNEVNKNNDCPYFKKKRLWTIIDYFYG